MSQLDLLEVLGLTAGRLPELLYSAIAFILVNFLIDVACKRRGLKVESAELGKKVLAYLAFLVIANRLDGLVINNLFGWYGSSQMITAIYIIGREIKIILKHVELLGVEPPPILERRVDDMINGQIRSDHDNSYRYTPPSSPFPSPFPSNPVSPYPDDYLTMQASNLEQELRDLQRRLHELQNQTTKAIPNSGYFPPR